MTEILSCKIHQIRRKRNGELHRCETCCREIPSGSMVVETACSNHKKILTTYICIPCYYVLCGSGEGDLYGGDVLDILHGGMCGVDDPDFDEETYWEVIYFFGYGFEKF